MNYGTIQLNRELIAQKEKLNLAEIDRTNLMTRIPTYDQYIVELKTKIADLETALGHLQLATGEYAGASETFYKG